MNIAYLGSFFKKARETGGNIHVKNFMDNMVSQGHTVYAAACDEHPLTKKLPRRWPFFFFALCRMDVLYYRVETGLPPDSNWLLAPYSWFLKRPVVAWEFNGAPEVATLMGMDKSSVRKSVADLKRHSHLCDLAICVSDYLNQYVGEKIGVRNRITIPNGSDPEKFCPRAQSERDFGIDNRALNIAWIGSVDAPWHNVGMLLAAADALHGSAGGHDIVFHIVGPKSDRLNDAPPNIRFHGYVPYERLPGVLSRMDVGLCLYNTSMADSFSPLKVFDYMASGLAVVGTKQPQLAQILDRLGHPHFLLAPNDAEALSKLLSGLSKNRALVKKMGEAGRRLVVDEYNWREVARKTTAALECAIAEKAARVP